MPYARVHNEGFTGSVVVPAHNRRTKKGKTVQVKAHKRMMRIPRRQFLGACHELERILKRKAEALFKSICHKLIFNFQFPIYEKGYELLSNQYL